MPEVFCDQCVASLSAVALFLCLRGVRVAAAAGRYYFPYLALLSEPRHSKSDRSVYSHIGIILLRDGKPYVYEAAKTVRFTPLKQWIARGTGNRYVVKRLKKPLTTSQQQALYREAMRYQSRPYDLTFSWDDERIYCSELVWKIYKNALNTEVGQLQILREFDLSSSEVQAKMKERYGKNIPLNETVISPVAMFDSPLLKTVYESR